MKAYFSVGLFCLISFSCSNQFLMEEAEETDILPVELLLSPTWDDVEYFLSIQGSGNASFTILNTPPWLHVHPSSGQFRNDTAFISCNVSYNKTFAETGVYMATMLWNIDGIGKKRIPITYINEGNPAMNTRLIQQNFTSKLEISNGDNGILLWAIVEKPDWMTISYEGAPLSENSMYALSMGMQAWLDLQLKPDITDMDNLKGRIVIVSNDKNNREKVVDIQYDMGNPFFYCHTNRLDFGKIENTQSLYFTNSGNGYLKWSIESCPEWLSVSESKGWMSPYTSKTLTFTCNRDLLPNGQHDHTIYMKTNDTSNPSYAITVTAFKFVTNPDNIIAIEGTITDAWMNKTSGILYLTTSQPNRLLAYNTATKTVDKSLVLSKAPNCFSLSDNGRQVIIGHGGLVSVVNTATFTVTNTLEVDYDLFDVEWGVGGWFCYTPKYPVQSYNLEWRNSDTLGLFDIPDTQYMLYGNTLVKKIPDMPYIIASRLALSPSGIAVYDVRTHTRVAYFHEELSDFWFSSDGNYIFSSNNTIYRTSSLFASSNTIFPIGKFSPSPNRIFGIDHNEKSHLVTILTSATDYYFDPSRVIQQYEDNDFKRLNTYYYDETYHNYPAQAHYVFSNRDGSELIVIKNVVSDNNINDWSIETILIK